MFNFFILGYIPGTNIQISFVMWLEGVAVFMALLYLRHLRTVEHEQAALLVTAVQQEEADPFELTQLARQVQLIHHIAATLLTSSADLR